MKFNLQRPTLNQEISRIISREVQKQETLILPLTRNKLKELAEISKIIAESGIPQYLVQKRLNRELGYGIFLHPKAKPLLKGQIIASYAGVISIIPQNFPDNSAFAFDLFEDIKLSKDEQLLVNKQLRYHWRRLYSLKLDALKKGNFTRFINHSEKPNVVAHLVAIPKNPYGLSPAPIEVVYFVKKTILPGEQLLVCYEAGEKSYWNAIDVKPFPMSPKTFRLSPSLKITT